MNDLLNLIKFGGLSRKLAGSRSVITSNRIGKKHRQAIALLEAKLKEWDDALPGLYKNSSKPS